MIMRGFVTGCALLAVVLGATTAFAQDPNYVLSLSDASGATGDTIHSIASLDSSSGGNVQGWSFGVCHNPAILTSLDIDLTGPASELNGGPGSMLGFASLQVYAGGVSCGVVIDLFGVNFLPPSAGFGLVEVDYDIVGTTDTTINACSTLGTPPVATVVVVGGASIPPVTIPGQIDVIDPNQLVASSATGLLGGQVDSTVSLNSVTLAPADAVQVSLSYDSGIVGVASVANTVGAEFFDVQPGAPGDLVVGLVRDTSDPITDQIPGGVLFTITWDGLAVGVSAVSFVDGLGTPPIDNAVIFGQDPPYQPTLIDGAITIVNFNPFLRSDCNSDSIVNIADGIYALNFLFQGGPAPVCDDACDSNDDGSIDAADAIYVFNYQFLEGPAPQAPFPVADLDPTTGDGLGCNGDADDI
jgi:hypothetical protein